MMKEKSCGCRIEAEPWERFPDRWIEFCPLHEAAADLLAACKTALKTWESGDEDDRKWLALKDAIAKAEGKAEP